MKSASLLEAEMDSRKIWNQQVLKYNCVLAYVMELPGKEILFQSTHWVHYCFLMPVLYK